MQVEISFKAIGKLMKQIKHGQKANVLVFPPV